MDQYNAIQRRENIKASKNRRKSVKNMQNSTKLIDIEEEDSIEDNEVPFNKAKNANWGAANKGSDPLNIFENQEEDEIDHGFQEYSDLLDPNVLDANESDKRSTFGITSSLIDAKPKLREFQQQSNNRKKDL